MCRTTLQLVLAAAVCGSAWAGPPTTQPVPDDFPLAVEVRKLLAADDVVGAMNRTEQERSARPDDSAVQAVYVELRMSIARQALAAQKFAEAEKLLRQVADADPKHPTAPKLLAVIADARTRIEPALADAEQLLRLERFEQAAELFAQAGGLLPDAPQRWQQGWLQAVRGAGDDHYMMRNYEPALSYYNQALELSGGDAAAQAASLGEDLMWRWAHSYSMVLAGAAHVRRTQEQWQAIIESVQERFAAARAQPLALFVAGMGRENIGDYANAIQNYRGVLGASAPPPAAGVAPAGAAADLRRRATSYVDSLNRGQQIGRRGGPWAAVLPGQPIVRRSAGVVVSARNDLAARMVLEAFEYHAPRLAAWLGGGADDLKWAVDYQIRIVPKFGEDPALRDPNSPSYSRITSNAGQLIRHQTVFAQNDPMLLGATAPHEMTHILLSRMSGYPMAPLAIDEGLAIHAETTPRYLMFRRSLIEAGGAKRSVEQMLTIDELPPTRQAVFYGECYGFVAWLLTRGDASKVVALCRATAKVSPTQALLDTYGFKDMATAEKAYRTFLEDQHLAPASQPEGR